MPSAQRARAEIAPGDHVVVYEDCADLYAFAVPFIKTKTDLLRLARSAGKRSVRKGGVFSRQGDAAAEVHFWAEGRGTLVHADARRTRIVIRDRERLAEAAENGPAPRAPKAAGSKRS